MAHHLLLAAYARALPNLFSRNIDFPDSFSYKDKIICVIHARYALNYLFLYFLDFFDNNKQY